MGVAKVRQSGRPRPGKVGVIDSVEGLKKDIGMVGRIDRISKLVN